MQEYAPVRQSRTAFAARFFNQLQHYRKLLSKYWWVPLLAFGLSDGIEWLVLKHTPPAFASAGRMIVNVKLSIPNANVYSEEFNNFYGTQVALMQSDSVLNRVNLSLQSKYPGWRGTPVKIEVTLSPKTSIFNLQAVGGDAGYTQAYLQATMEAYIDLKKDLLANATTATQASMEEQLNQMAVQLQSNKDALLNYQSSNSVVFLQPSGGNNAADYLSLLTRQLNDSRNELLMLQTLTLDQNLEREKGIFVRQNPAAPSSSNSVPPQGQASATAANDASQNNIPSNLGGFEDAYLQAKQQLILLREQRDELTNSNARLATNALPMVDLNEQIAHQEKLLEIYKEQSQEQLGNRQHTLQLQITNLESQVKEWEKQAMDVSKKLSDFEALKENQRRLQAAYDQMQANLQTLDVNKGIGQESVTILEPATPAAPVPPESRKHLVMAGLIGLVLGLGVLLFINQLDDRINSFTELEQTFDLPVLGQIPLVKCPRDQTPILQLDDTRYPLIEAYRSLRSAFLYKDSLKEPAKGPPKSIVVSSAGPNDGKSMTSANFAITLAQGGSGVLLIDADCHRGVLHKYFSVAPGPGLAEVLTGQCEWKNAVVPTPIPNLHVMPCGIRPKNYGNLFARIHKFTAAIAGNYNYCIFDTVPVLVADDVLSLAPHVDGLILVIRAEFTSGRMAQAALDLLRQRNVNVVGLVFNAVHPKASDYYCYRYKEYYSQQPTA